MHAAFSDYKCRLTDCFWKFKFIWSDRSPETVVFIVNKLLKSSSFLSSYPLPQSNLY